LIFENCAVNSALVKIKDVDNYVCEHEIHDPLSMKYLNDNRVLNKGFYFTYPTGIKYKSLSSVKKEPKLN